MPFGMSLMSASPPAPVTDARSPDVIRAVAAESR
jgi:hypothetical protein